MKLEGWSSLLNITSTIFRKEKKISFFWITTALIQKITISGLLQRKVLSLQPEKLQLLLVQKENESLLMKIWTNAIIITMEKDKIHQYLFWISQKESCWKKTMGMWAITSKDTIVPEFNRHLWPIELSSPIQKRSFNPINSGRLFALSRQKNGDTTPGKILKKQKKVIMARKERASFGRTTEAWKTTQ